MALIRPAVNYIPDLNFGRPLSDAQVYLLTSTATVPQNAADINPTDLLTVTYLNDADNTVEAPQPLRTTKGGCLFTGCKQVIKQFSVNALVYIYAVYDKNGNLEYQGKTTGSDFVDVNDFTALLEVSTISFPDVTSMSSSTRLSIGDVIYLKGFTQSGDGAGHFRKISTGNDGTGIAVGVNFANIVTDTGYIDTDWLGPNVSIAQIKLLLDYSAKFKPKKLYTLNQAWSLWSARQEFPIAFFGDSTTDGYGTTGHVASVPTITGVEINNSPNAYPQLLEDVIKRAIPSYPVGSRVVYNAGFDSQSMANDFALDKFDSIFIESGAPFLGTRMIGFAWGVTDVINLNSPITALSVYAKKPRDLDSLQFGKRYAAIFSQPRSDVDNRR